MSEEINKILDKFDRTLEEYELDKKVGQPSIDSIYFLYPSEMITIKNYIRQKENIIKEVREYNEQIIKDTKDFYRPTEDIIYSGDCLIDIATQNLEILDKERESK